MDLTVGLLHVGPYGTSGAPEPVLTQPQPICLWGVAQCCDAGPHLNVDSQHLLLAHAGCYRW